MLSLRHGELRVLPWPGAKATLGCPKLQARGLGSATGGGLRACAHDAANLLSRWPTRLDRRMSWLPVGMPGGTEDLPMTERQVERRGYLWNAKARRLSRRAPAGSVNAARWYPRPSPCWRRRSSSLSGQVCQLSNSLFFRPLLDPLALVARVAAAPAGYRDPDPSSWPVVFAAFSASCMVAIAELQSSERGEGVVPLLDTDELYEAWLAVQVRAALDDRFGAWKSPGSDALAAWEHDDTLYELWLKPGISRDGRRFGSESFQAVVAEQLTPDLVLSSTRGDETELMVLDAKAWAQMLPEDVLSAKRQIPLRHPSHPRGAHRPSTCRSRSRDMRTTPEHPRQ